MIMEVTRIIKLKLDIPVEKVLPAIAAYTSAYNFVAQTGWDGEDANGVSLHKKTYYQSRAGFDLPAQLAISSRMRATESLKSAFTAKKKKETVSCPQSKSLAIRYDARSFTVWFDRNEVSILTLGGRITTSFSIPEYFKQYIDWKRASADLFIKNGNVFLSIVMQKSLPDIAPVKEAVGVDRGLNKLAVTSNNKFYGGSHTREVSLRYKEIRKKLQAAGTKSAKRHLKRLSGKENRFKADVNHCISKSIVRSVAPGSTIVLENLKDIRKKSKLRKKQRTEINSWSFFQLEQFLVYKAEPFGITIKYVCPRYTSQRCNNCGYRSKANRTCQSNFKCKQCSFQLNADLNASRNIRDKMLDSISSPARAPVNEPIVATDLG